MKVVTFGEIMLRLSSGLKRFVQSDNFTVEYGGGEANVAVALANFGVESYFVTKLPKNEIGQAAVNSVRRYGVDVKYITRGGERTGIYFLEKGASVRPSKVIYDRAYSAISMAEESDFDWDAIFEGVSWFHFTGITPALSDKTAKITLSALKIAKKKGVTVSCDLNYRTKLWSREKAGKVMTELMDYVDYLIANEEDAKNVFGIAPENGDVISGELEKDGYRQVAKKLADKFGFKGVAITLRGSLSASDNLWSGLYYDGSEYYQSKEYSLHLVDRVGGGDSFGAGLIYALSSGFEPKRAIEFAVGASALKQTIEGDVNLVSVEEINKLIGGDGSGRVER